MRVRPYQRPANCAAFCIASPVPRLTLPRCLTSLVSELIALQLHSFSTSVLCAFLLLTTSVIYCLPNLVPGYSSSSLFPFPYPRYAQPPPPES